VIPLRRHDLPPVVAARLGGRAARLRDGTATGREAWKTARTVRRDLKAELERMAPGLARCMYCGDGQGTDIDHFKPIAVDPAVTFVWTNHYLACSHCNSNAKRDQYPCDPEGRCLLVDPCRDDPFDHLRLTFPTGRYTGLTPKGEHTIRVFGLARPVLERGRAMAYVRCRSMLRDWLARRDDDPGEAEKVMTAFRVQPFADVLHAMTRSAGAPGAGTVFGADVLTALRSLPGGPGGPGHGQ
jgi:uncharacterized protein (TIGR02646 family)